MVKGFKLFFLILDSVYWIICMSKQSWLACHTHVHTLCIACSFVCRKVQTLRANKPRQHAPITAALLGVNHRGAPPPYLHPPTHRPLSLLQMVSFLNTLITHHPAE